jgi:hypothetical protein
MVRRLIAALALAALAAGCSSLLPKTTETSGNGWRSYRDAEQSFDAIIVGSTTVAELRAMNIDPRVNPNIAILTRADVMQRFMVNRTVSIADLDDGVRECISAPARCQAYEVNQNSMQKARSGNALLDLLRFHRETRSTGWRFNALLLVKDGIVVYKLTGGQPAIVVIQENHDPLGPLQSLAKAYTGVTAALESERRDAGQPQQPYPANPVLGVSPSR